MRRSLTMPDIVAHYGSMHIVHFNSMVNRMKSLGHRLLEFGWESAVDHLEPYEACILASTLPPNMHDVILAAVLEHGAGEYEAMIRSLPQFAQEPAHV
jgi:hypothetical protein